MGGRAGGWTRTAIVKAAPTTRLRPTDRPTAATAVAKVEGPAAMVTVVVATAESFEWVSGGGEQSSRCACGEWCYYPLSGREGARPERGKKPSHVESLDDWDGIIFLGLSWTSASQE